VKLLLAAGKGLRLLYGVCVMLLYMYVCLSPHNFEPVYWYIICLPVCCQKNLKMRIYKTMILPVVLYRCETWSLILTEEHRLRVFENRVLRRIFGPKRDEVTEEWRKLHNEKLHDIYSLSSIERIIKSRRMRWAGHVARMIEKREMRIAYWWESQREGDH
jgi:hypothetical protein